jgi:chaperonin GroEL (HSP60 family)
MVVIEGCEDPESVTALLPGTFDQGGEQLTRQLRKAAAAVAAAAGHGTEYPGYLPGGGATELAAARRVRDAATGHDSKAQLAVEAFADALEMIPFTLAKNAGGDPIGTVADVRARQSADGDAYGYAVPER